VGQTGACRAQFGAFQQRTRLSEDFVFDELYKGYRRLIAEPYEFRNFRRRTLEFILNRAAR
jgi:hypothetical protein